MNRAKWLQAALLTLWIGASPAKAAGTGVYKWTDEQGAVHYSDQMPSDAMSNKGGVVLDKQGRSVKKIEPAPTPEQVRAKQEEDERQRVAAKAQDDKNRRDRALTMSYTTEDEIEIARNRSLTTIDSQIKSAEAYSADLARRQQVLEKQKLGYSGSAVPVPLESELSGIVDELARQHKLMAQKREEMVAVNAKYDADKQRWRDLKTDPPKPAVAATGSTAASGGPVVRPATASCR